MKLTGYVTWPHARLPETHDDLQSFIGMVGIEQDARPAAVGSDVQAVVFGDGSDLAQGAGPRLRSTAGEIACPTWPAIHCQLPVTPAPVRSLVFCRLRFDKGRKSAIGDRAQTRASAPP